MKKTLLALMLLSSFFISGCVTIDPDMNTVSANTAVPEVVFDGVYKGEGLRVMMNGNVRYSFNASLKAYNENGAIYLQETLANARGIEKRRTFRITPAENYKYSCVDIETLRSCKVMLSGDTIIIKGWLNENFGSDFRHYNVMNVYQFFPDGKLIKRTTYNKFLIYFETEEIISYLKQ